MQLSQQPQQAPPPNSPWFGGDNFAYVFENDTMLELHGASDSELARFTKAHPTAHYFKKPF